MNRYDKPVLRSFYGAGGIQQVGKGGVSNHTKRTLSQEKQNRYKHPDHVFLNYGHDFAPEVELLIHPSSCHIPQTISNIRKCKQTHRRRMNAFRSNQQESYF